MRCIPIVVLLALLHAFQAFSQHGDISINYEPSATHPFGKLNPDAPKQVADFAPMIGICDCRSVQRKPDGSWQDTLDMIWKFKYIMNGTAVQDEVWREGNQYAGSIRQYQPDSAKWVVTYFSYPLVSTKPGVWQGAKDGDNIVLKMPQKAPNGSDGSSRLTFYNIAADGFKWKGEWISTDESIVYPFWMIECRKRKE